MQAHLQGVEGRERRAAGTRSTRRERRRERGSQGIAQQVAGTDSARDAALQRAARAVHEHGGRRGSRGRGRGGGGGRGRCACVGLCGGLLRRERRLDGLDSSQQPSGDVGVTRATAHRHVDTFDVR